MPASSSRARKSPGPSGLLDWPRPFVFRAGHLDGETVAPGEPFSFDLNFFDLRSPAAIGHLGAAFAELAREGLGPGRGRAELVAFAPPAEPLTLSLDPLAARCPARARGIRYSHRTQRRG